MADHILGYQQIVSPAGATALTVPTGTRYALLQCDTQNVRWREDGTAPTASVGLLAVAGTAIPYTINEPLRCQVIQTAVNANVNVQYYQ